MTIFRKNDLLTVDLIGVNSFGLGVAKADGCVIFVQYGVTGDRAEVRIIKTAKNYCVARIENLLSPSPYRAEPDCPAYKSCGGCRFRHLTYEYERELKRSFVCEAFRRAGLSGADVAPVFSDGATARYRNKAQYPFTVKDGAVSCGFFAEKTHRVTPVEDCLIQDERFAAVTAFICRFLQENDVPVYDENTGEGLARHLYLRCGKGTGEVSLCLVLTRDELPNEKDFVRRLRERFPFITSVSVNVNPKNTNVILGERTRALFGESVLSDVLCGKRFRISPLSFYQVNHDMAERLYQKAFELADLKEGDTLFDLYCGIGTVSICGAAPGVSVFGVEIVEDAVKNAKENARLNGVENAKFFCGDAALAFERFCAKEKSRTCVIVDPPRKGLSLAMVDALAKESFPKIVYISCNPETLARDLALFGERGYDFGTVYPFDLFPRTAHVESVVLMSRVGS